jgi:hypothetical protein
MIYLILLEQNTFVSDDALCGKRLALILPVLHDFHGNCKFSNKEYATEVCCLDIDFESAVSLVKTYLQHSIIMFENLPKQEGGGSFKSGQNKKLFLIHCQMSFNAKKPLK